MGLGDFLERRAIKRARRRLRIPADEDVVDFDIGTLDGARRVRVDFVATSEALYVFDNWTNTANRLPYEAIEVVAWNSTEPADFSGFPPEAQRVGRAMVDAMLAGRFAFKTVGGESLSVTLKRPHRRMADYVASRVDSLTVYRTHVTLTADGRGAELTFRPLMTPDSFGWQVTPDEGVNLEAPDHAATLRTAMREHRRQALDAARHAGREPNVHASGRLRGLHPNEHQGDGEAVAHSRGITFVVHADGGQHIYGWDEVEAFWIEGEGSLVVKMGRPSRHRIMVDPAQADELATELRRRGVPSSREGQ